MNLESNTPKRICGMNPLSSLTSYCLETGQDMDNLKNLINNSSITDIFSGIGFLFSWLPLKFHEFSKIEPEKSFSNINQIFNFYLPYIPVFIVYNHFFDYSHFNFLIPHFIEIFIKKRMKEFILFYPIFIIFHIHLILLHFSTILLFCSKIMVFYFLK